VVVPHVEFFEKHLPTLRTLPSIQNQLEKRWACGTFTKCSKLLTKLIHSYQLDDLKKELWHRDLISVKPGSSVENVNLLRNRIKRATNPFLSVQRYNQSLPPEEHWEIQLIIGPFVRSSTEFRSLWQRKSRKLTSRIVFGCKAATELRHSKGVPLRVFSRRPYHTLRLVKKQWRH
jgi:hypothetical protein